MLQLGLSPHFHQLDIDDAASISKFADYIKKTYGGLDALVNNAAIAYKVSVNIVMYICTLLIPFVEIYCMLLQQTMYHCNVNEGC